MPPLATLSEYSFQPDGQARPSFACLLQAKADGPTWVRLSGELDIASVSLLKKALRHTEHARHVVVLDLRGLSFIDSCGVHEITGAAESAQQADHRLIVIGGPPQVARMLSLSTAARRLDIIALHPAWPDPVHRSTGFES